jgi:hypothetical protein
MLSKWWWIDYGSLENGYSQSLNMWASLKEEGDGVWEVRSGVGVGEKRAKERGCRGWAMVECQDKGCSGFG